MYGIETIMPQKHYSLAWFDNQHVEHHICEYADDAYTAHKHAVEDVPYLREHPYSVYEVLQELT
tara:strand:- start:526 stop:717 length:192 start_codon:yes stop_codon:yes gene_type:complete